VHFQRGRVVLHRHFHGDRLGLLKTAWVLGDDERGLLLWVPQGAPMLDRKAVDGRGLRAMPFPEWFATETKLWEVTWHGPGVLMYLPPGQDHSIWVFRDAGGRFTGYYVNLEECGVRWDDGDVAGVDIVDQDLDIWVPAPRARERLTWVWKDEEEFAERLAYPQRYWVSDGDAVRAEGRRVIKLIEAGAFPFNGDLLAYQPDPQWTVPSAVPAGWERPRVFPGGGCAPSPVSS
jgi:predicted RNA-binding protein associated with RNAse of E/G family